jgi:uncharacterized protein YndB with AHSA1/START domain
MYSAHVEIPATPARVFHVLTDPALLKRWQPEVVEAHPPEGGLRVGAVAHGIAEEFGRRFPVQLVVRRLEPDRALSYDMTTPMWSGRIDYVLTRQPESTTLSLHFAPVPPTGWKRYPLLVLGIATRPLMLRHLRKRLLALSNVVQATTG